MRQHILHDAVYAVFYWRMGMIIDRELLIQRRYIFVEGCPDVPVPVILHRLKKYHFVFT